MEFNEVEGFQVFDASYVFVTETGFPVMATATMPHVLSLKGSLTMSPMAGNVLPKVSAKFVPVYHSGSGPFRCKLGRTWQKPLEERYQPSSSQFTTERSRPTVVS